MHLTHLTLRDFRNYSSAELALEPGVQVFEGANGQGKTNLVEAIGYLATLHSHRVSSDVALVRHGSEHAFVSATLVAGRRQLELDVHIQKSGSNRVRAGGHQVRARELPRFITTVLFAPEDLTLVRGEPSSRRAFVDGLLMTHSPRLAGILSDYERVLRQRNALLRQGRGRGIDASALDSLEEWDARLLDFGTEIIMERLAVIERLTPHLERAYLALVGADHAPGLSLQLSAVEDAGKPMDTVIEERELTAADVRARFAERLAGARQRELERGVSLIGPHRDDVLFQLNGLPARITASHGEAWSFALSLKLAAAELVRSESRTGDPVLILDDVFAELDAARRSRLADAIAGFEQVLITCAVLDDIPEPMRHRTTRIQAGEILGAPA